MAFNQNRYRPFRSADLGNQSARRAWLALLGALCVGFSSGGAWAQSAEVNTSVSTEEAVASSEGPSFRMNYFELGAFLGMIFPSKKHNFIRSSLESDHREFNTVAPELGLRAAYFPIAFVGAEIEAMGALTETESGARARLWALRAHGLVQYPAKITPFLLVGGGRMGAKSGPTGGDGDPLLHFGGGAKYAIDDLLGVRLDVRDNLTQKFLAKDGKLTHHPEITLGVTFSLDLSKKKAPPPPPPPDTDGDGVLDASDRCPKEPGPAPEGCPLPKDTDGDGFTDDKDACPNEVGIAPDGCPDPDPDKDGIKGDADKCPDQAGIEPDGCPDTDPDKDGIKGEADKCPTEPETKNGFEDQDGCPDKVPEKVKKYSGVIPGIEFDVGKSTIRPGSRAVLDEAVQVLKEYPSVRISISGHTDDRGTRELNLNLSQARAEAVRAYIIGSGIDASRIESRGAGPDEPIADNKTAAGRQKNRRIEFKLIAQ